MPSSQRRRREPLSVVATAPRAKRREYMRPVAPREPVSLAEERAGCVSFAATMGLRTAVTLALGLALAGCTIERTRQLGDDCLMDRECASGLRCQSSLDGTLRCTSPARFDVPLIPGTDATPEASSETTPPPPPDVTDAPRDTATPDVTTPDVTDAARDVSTPDVTDAARDASDGGDASDASDASDGSDASDASDVTDGDA